MHFTALFIATIGATMVAGSPLARRSDYTTCLDICSGDNSQCLSTNPGSPVNVDGVIFLCNAQALACEAFVCATTQDIESVLNDGLPAVVALLKAAES